jgi:Phospholipase_D-nuclease N-terminal/Short C-terminal domain
MVVATTFLETFFLLLIFLPLVMVWAFALVDIFRRDDMGGGSKALWVFCVIVLPFVGTMLYLVLRPGDATRGERARARHSKDQPSDSVIELAALADLHDRGKLTDAEYAAQKARVLGSEPPVPA